MADNTPLWTPTDPSSTRTYAFMRAINAKYNVHHSSYQDLYDWSISHPSEFWDAVWDETNIVGEKGAQSNVIHTEAPMRSIPPWFAGAKLNWAENMLKHRESESIALIQATEPTPDNPNPPYIRITHKELYEKVAIAVDSLREMGIQPGDRIASYASNCIENVIAALACTALGGIWVSAAADFGPDGVLERLEQVKPRILISVNAVVYNAKVHDHIPKLSQVLEGLAKRSLSPKAVIVIPLQVPNAPLLSLKEGWLSWDTFLGGTGSKESRRESKSISFWRGPFDHPLWILFSSGTTGKPKPIVHRAGGMLIQSAKELLIQGDLSPFDVFFYYTTTGWMMWNFLVGGLSSGCSLVLYDGSPLKDPSLLWKMTDELDITIFGTSAKYLEQLAKGYKPRLHNKLSSLRMIMSTGSPLAPAQFDYVYEDIKRDVLLGSITGGTDICSLFAGHNTALPVYRGEIQCRMLGMSIHAYTDDGKPAPSGEEGELVCNVNFPVQPIGFWPLDNHGASEEDVQNAKKRYDESYYDKFDGVWYHGDHVLITESRNGNGGGVIMLGRSDGVLNPGGIRFGSSEIYDILSTAFTASPSTPSSHVIIDSLVVAQPIRTDTIADERVILFLLLLPGETLSEDLIKRIKEEIRKKRSPRHVPARILQVQDIPHTLNGKKVEVPVKKLIAGASKASLNASTLQNPECLDEYERLGVLLRTEVEKTA